MLNFRRFKYMMLVWVLVLFFMILIEGMIVIIIGVNDIFILF